jgi:2-polyprenyl-3-methyl-5-hydroxy-6-metoxy-1,4-benzoquinol methylase
MRERKARTIHAVLKDRIRAEFSNLSVLDAAASTGIIAHYLAR